MTIFKKGDKVQRTNGFTFSNGCRFATVSKVEIDRYDTKVWFEETGTFLTENSVELVRPVSAVDEVKQKVYALIKTNDKELDELNKKISDIQDKNKKLNYVLTTLEDLND